jgi:hypothetical protein
MAVAFVFALGSTQAFASVAAHPTINTFKDWNGSDFIQPFGCPNTTTYGQVITIPAGKTHLNKYVFKWVNLSTGKMFVRGEVYAWDGAKATGSALFETAPRKIKFLDSDFHYETFSGGGVTVTPGHQYVVFASIDKDYESCTNSYEVGWASPFVNDYPGGDFVYQNNSGDESQWTTTPWSDIGFDAAIKVFLGI